MTIAEKLTQIAENEQKVFDAGKSEATNEFWDVFTNNGERVNYSYAFYNWSSEYIRPTRKIIPTDEASARSTFYKCPNLKKIEAAYFDFSQKNKGTSEATGYSYTFYGCKKLEEIEDIGIEADYQFNHTFECVKLRTIARIGTDENTKFSGAFDYASSLENVTFDGVIGQNINVRWSTKLSKASIENIVSCLSDTASGKTLSLSQTAVNNAFTDAEWTALADTKKNWTISLQ